MILIVIFSFVFILLISINFLGKKQFYIYKYNKQYYVQVLSPLNFKLFILSNRNPKNYKWTMKNIDLCLVNTIEEAKYLIEEYNRKGIKIET